MKAVWGINLSNEMNITLAFTTVLKSGAPAELKIAAGNFYRLFINGKLSGYGPARASERHVRIDTYQLVLKSRTKIVVEVLSNNLNYYCGNNEKPFFAAEIIGVPENRHRSLLDEKGLRSDICGDEILASTENNSFKCYLISDRAQKTQRYNAFRGFTEYYIQKKCKSLFYTEEKTTAYKAVKTEEVSLPVILERNAPYPAFSHVSRSVLAEMGCVVKNQNAENENAVNNYHDYELKENFQKFSDEIRLSGEISKFDYNVLVFDLIQVRSPKYLLYEFPRVYNGFINLKLKVLKRAVIYAVFSQLISKEKSKKAAYVNFSENNQYNIIKWELAAGEYNLLSFEPYSFKYLKIIISEGTVDIDSAGLIKYENSEDLKLITAGDKRLALIADAAVHTFRQNAVDILTGSLSQNAGKLGGSYFMGAAEFILTGKNLCEKNFLENYALMKNSEYSEFLFPTCYPSYIDGNFVADITLWYIIEVEEYTKRSKDKKVAELSKDRIIKLINYFNKFLNGDGLLENVSDNVLIDESLLESPEFFKGVNYPLNMIYSAALDAAGRLYKNDLYTEQAKNMRMTISVQSFNGEFFVDNRVRNKDGVLVLTNNISEACQYFAFYFSIAQKEAHAKLLKILTEDFGIDRIDRILYKEIKKASFRYSFLMRFETLMKYNKKERLESEILSLINMAEKTGTIWEGGECSRGFMSFIVKYIEYLGER